jgi:ribosomal protein L37AE/L43A
MKKAKPLPKGICPECESKMRKKRNKKIFQCTKCWTEVEYK